MTSYIKGINSLAYQGVNASTPPNIRILKRPPATNDTKNVNLGDFWLNTETEILYQLVSLANDIAVWNEVATPAGVGTSFFDTDAGTAQDLNQRINIIGGSNINTAGAGSTVTYNLNNTVAISGSLTAGTGVTATTGNIRAIAGSVIAGANATITGDLAVNSAVGSSVNIQAGTGGNTLNSTGAAFISTSSGSATAITLQASNPTSGMAVTTGNNGVSITTTGLAKISTSGLLATAVQLEATNGGVVISATEADGLTLDNGTQQAQILVGSGDPNTNPTTGLQGSLFIRTDTGVAATTLYVNTDGANAWTALT